jgi:hypothetical protein
MRKAARDMEKNAQKQSEKEAKKKADEERKRKLEESGFPVVRNKMTQLDFVNELDQWQHE